MLICLPSRSAVLATSVMAWVRCSSKTPGGSSRRRQVVEEAEQDGFGAVGVQAAAARVELRAVGFRGVGGDAVHGVELADAVQQYVVSSGLLGGGVGAVQMQRVQAVCDRSSGVDEGCGEWCVGPLSRPARAASVSPWRIQLTEADGRCSSPPIPSLVTAIALRLNVPKRAGCHQRERLIWRSAAVRYGGYHRISRLFVTISAGSEGVVTGRVPFRSGGLQKPRLVVSA